MGGINALIAAPKPARGARGATSGIYLATVEVITMPLGAILATVVVEGGREHPEQCGRTAQGSWG